jgi:hypothetical protein
MIEYDAVLLRDESTIGTVPQGEVQLGSFLRCAWASDESLDIKEKVMERS